MLFTASLLLLLAPDAHAARPLPAPRAEVSAEPELISSLPTAVRTGLQNTEYGSWELGASFVVGSDWRIERASTGIVLGRSKEVETLARASSKKCYALHMRVLQEFDGKDYVSTYRAWRAVATVDGTEAERHAIDCALYRP